MQEESIWKEYKNWALFKENWGNKSKDIGLRTHKKYMIFPTMVDAHWRSLVFRIKLMVNGFSQENGIKE